MLQTHFDPEKVYVVFLVQQFLDFGDLRIRVLEDPFQEMLARNIRPTIIGVVALTFDHSSGT